MNWTGARTRPENDSDVECVGTVDEILQGGLTAQRFADVQIPGGVARASGAAAL